MEKPEIICLCGSTRFTDIMLVIQWEFTKQGKIVVSWCALPDWYFNGQDNTHVGDQEGVKEIVDEVHLRKIDLADRVYVINKDGYIGESTANEIAYAVRTPIYPITLYDYLWQRRDLPSIRQRRCTDHYKIRPIQKYVGTATLLIGFSSDEAQRALRKKPKKYPREYPLLDLGLSANDCRSIKIIILICFSKR